MTPKFLTSKSFITNLKILHTSITVSQILFVIVVLILNLSDFYDNEVLYDYNQFYSIATPFAIVISFTLCGTIVKTRIKNGKKIKNFKNKLTHYQITLLIKYALWALPSIVALIGSLITSNYFFLLLSIGIITIFLLDKPNIDKCIRRLNLNTKETEHLKKPDYFFSDSKFKL